MQSNTMKFTVGLFVLSVFFLLFIFLFLLLQEKGTFEKRYSYNFTVDSAEYFHTGMPVKFSGFTIGVIDSVSLNDDGSVFIIFSTPKRNQKWLSQGSVLMLIKPLIGSPHIELYTSLDTPLLEDKSSMIIVYSDDINDLIIKLQPAVAKTLNVLNNVETITSYLAREDSELRKILLHLEKFSAKLANDNSLLTSVTGDEKASKDVIKSLDETTKILKEMKKITRDISKITSTLAKDVIQPTSSSIHEIEAIMKDIKNKLEVMDGTVNAVGSYDKDLVEIKEQITVGIQKSNEIMDKVDSFMQDDSNNEVTLP